MKVGVYSLSLSDKKPAEVVESARTHGCAGVEWWCREGGHVDRANLAASARTVAALMKESGLETAGLAPYFNTPEARKPGEVEAVFAAARTLGARNVRCHSFGYPDPDKTPYAELMKRQRGWLEDVVVPAAERAGVRLNIEQHHYNICCTPNACRQLVEGLPVKRVGVIYDPGNSLWEGFTDAPYAVDVLGPYLAHVHCKASAPVFAGGGVPRGRRFAHVWGAMKDGELDWEGIVRALAAAGYDGYLSIEALDQRPSDRKMAEDAPFLLELLKTRG